MENKKVKVSRIMIFAINVCLLYLIGRTFISSLLLTYSELEKPWCDCISEGITFILTAAMCLVQRNDIRSYGLCRGTYKGSLKYIIPLAVVALMLTPYFFMFKVKEPLIPAIVDVVYVGIMEELVFRGAVFKGTEVLTDEHKAVLISSVLFGLFHLVNLSGDFAVSYVLLQVAFNAVIGLGLAALRAKTGSIFICMIIHIFLDINGLFGKSVSWMEKAQIVMYFVVGILLYVIYRLEKSKTSRTPSSPASPASPA